MKRYQLYNRGYRWSIEEPYSWDFRPYFTNYWLAYGALQQIRDMGWMEGIQALRKIHEKYNSTKPVR